MSMLNDKTVSVADQALIDGAIREAQSAYEKRRNEFCEALGLTHSDWDEGVKAHMDYIARIGHLRPFHRAPIAVESFVAGFYAERLKV